MSTSNNRGVFLPKSMFIPTYSTSGYNSPFKTQKTFQSGGKFSNAPSLVDWGLIFNLSVFTIFVCSIFYICLYRYRNKEKIRRETELKKRKLAYEFQQAMEENRKNQAVKKYNQILENKRYNQMMVNANLDNLRLQMTNPYLLNENNNTNYTNNYTNNYVPKSYSSNTSSQKQNSSFPPLSQPNFNSSSQAILNDNLNTFYDNNPKQKEHNNQNVKYDPDVLLDKVGKDSNGLKDSDMYFAAYDNFDFNTGFNSKSYASANFDLDTNIITDQNQNSNKNKSYTQNKTSENNKGYDMMRKGFKVDEYKPISYSNEFNKFF